MEKAQQHIKALQRRYTILRIAEVFLVGISIALFTLAILEVSGGGQKTIATAAPAAGLIATALAFFVIRPDQINERVIARILNENHLVLENSADLLVADPSGMTLLQRIQRQRVAARLNEVKSSTRLPHRVGITAIIFLLTAVFTLIVVSIPQTIDTHYAIQTPVKPEITTPLPSEIAALEIGVAPPRYTGLKQRSGRNPDVEVLEGSVVTWSIRFTESPATAWITFSNGDSAKLEKKGEEFLIAKSFRHSEIYLIGWKSTEGISSFSDYYRVTVIKDNPPDIKVQEPAKFTEIMPGDDVVVDVRSRIKDDYGIVDAWIVATVSKGSGESVKFREERIRFTTPKRITGKDAIGSVTLDPKKLGMEPGDELYFYVEAFDNRMPERNSARTETYFIEIIDTAELILSVEGGLGVDLMPEYFRSQRQIIIDSEKLLTERNKISVSEFNRRSNELGYDQKVLRLRYGQFLGEEFENAIGSSDVPDHDHPDQGTDHEQSDDEDPVAQFRHDHDTDNEHNLVPDPQHRHDDEEDESEDPWQSYKHMHDDPEEATFFTQSIRTKLKAALTEMWGAELHLRLFDPAKSLPYQYKALRLLKEISNDSRIYVHKTGFDAPPLKEDRRLTGDLSEVSPGQRVSSALRGQLFPSIRVVLPMLSAKISARDTTLNKNEKFLLTQAGNEIAQLVLEQPGKYLETLSAINRVTRQNSTHPGRLKEFHTIQRTLWQLIQPDLTPSASRSRATHGLDTAFIDGLNKQPR